MVFLKATLLPAVLICVSSAQNPSQIPGVAPPTQVPQPEQPSISKTPNGRLRRTSDDRTYSRGTRALDDGRWEDARDIFNAIADDKGPRADGALYWKAYAENRLGHVDTALATLTLLRREYPLSDWLNEAQSLTAELQQQAGKPVDSNIAANEDIKLMALNALIHSAPEQALPLIATLLNSASSPRLRDRALFVLAQSKSPQAQQLLLRIAETGSNPDLQVRALTYIALSGNKRATVDIVEIYNVTHNEAIKRRALISLVTANAGEELFNIARSEKTAALRTEAIRSLAILHSLDKLMRLYQAGIAKEAIIESMSLLRTPAPLLEIVQNEKNANIRSLIIHLLGRMHAQPLAIAGLVDLYPREPDNTLRKEIIDSLWLQRDAKALVDIIKRESNPDMKQYVARTLSLMRAKESN